MEKPSDEKPDDLEIASIGSLYCGGNWDKKYWSSSRGKDRYPYPVGYQAVRTHSGITYRMEIREGLKGPVFAVTSPDGDSYTGQTPDIAWENFQKKSCSRVKNWLGKRYSSKIDGVELFGFRNPFVQRLLRELVANVNGVAERSLAAPNLASRASKLDTERIEGSHEFPSLLPYLEKKRITRKRSMKTRSSAEILIKKARIKRTGGQASLNGPACNDSKLDGRICSFSKPRSTEYFQGENVSSFKDTDTVQVTSSDHRNSLGEGVAVMDTELLDPESQNDANHVRCASSIKNCDRTADLGSSLRVKLSNVTEENCHSLLAVDKELVKSKHSAYFVKKNVLSHEQSNHFGHENPVLTYAVKTQIEDSFETKPEQRDSLTSQKNNGGEYVDLMTYPDAYVPDTCDTEKDSIVGFPLEGCMARVCSMKNQPDVARPVPKTSASCASNFPSRCFPEELNRESKCNISKSMHPISEVHSTSPPVNALAGVVTDSLPEAGSSSGSSNPSSDKTDLDLAGQELAKSMMTFLLPRAVPLLTKTYVKRRSRHRNRENKHVSGSPLLVSNSAEQVENKDLTDIVCQGKDVAEVLVPGPEVNLQEKMKVPQALPGADSLWQLTRIEPLSAGCRTTEPFTENGCSEVAKSVIQDSFGDDHAHDSAFKRPSSHTSDEVDIGFFERIKGNINSPVLPENSSEMHCFCSKDDGWKGEILLPDGNKKDNTEAEVPSYGCMPRESLSTRNRAEPSEKGPPHYEVGDEVPKTETIHLHMVCSAEKDHSCSQIGQINFDIQAATDFKDANVKKQVGGPHFAYVGSDIKTDSTVKGESFLLCKSKVLSSEELLSNSHKIGKIPLLLLSSKNYIIPLSEIIICRNYKNCNSPESHFPQKIPDRDENDEPRCTASDADIRMPLTNGVKMDGELHQLITLENIAASVHVPIVSAPDAFQSQDIVMSVNKELRPSHVSNLMDCVNSARNVCLQRENCIQSEEQMNALRSLPYSDTDIDPPMHSTISRDCKGYNGQPHTEILQKSHLDDSLSKSEKSTMETKDSKELIGCYLHPKPVLLISLASKEDSLQICVLCGLVDSDIRELFMYMIPLHGYRGNYPSFLGYTSLMLPSYKDPCFREIPLERSVLQFIPSRQSLVFSNSIKAPHCRKQSFDCSCTNCTLDYTEENSVEIVHVNFGYVSSVVKLVTVERASSILACDPNYLIAVEQSGKLHVWVMNLEWSVNLEDFMLPKFDEISSVTLELKKIPNYNSLIIGHNGLGGFAVWDIFQRVLLAKFSSPGITTFQILPVGLFKWQNKDSLATCMETDDTKATTIKPDNPCPQAGEDPSLSSLDEDIAVWLLVSADSGMDMQHQVEERTMVPVGCWRLGLLVRNAVVLGSILDPRASAARASSNYGIYGTCDGFLYKWELSSGEPLACLHPFKCGRVSDIAIDAKSGAFAVAGSGCQLLVYAQPRVQM